MSDDMRAMMKANNELAAFNSITNEHAKAFIEWLDVKKQSVKTYSESLRIFMNYLTANQIVRPSRDDFIAFRDEQTTQFKPATVQARLLATRLFFEWLEAQGYYKNITSKVKGPKIERTHKKDSLTTQQAKALLASAQKSHHGERDYALLLLLMTCGLRTVEVERANVEDLRTLGDKTVLYVQGKGKDEKADYVIVPPELEKALRAYLRTRLDHQNKSPLFISHSRNQQKGNGRLTTRTISYIVKKHLREIGLDSERLTAHSLRHTAVTLALLGGSSLQEASQFARHANITTTQIYAHNLEKLKNSCSSVVTSKLLC